MNDGMVHGITGVDPFALAVAIGIFSLVPFIVIATTSFLKISVVTMLLRNALGLQQVPPNMALYSLSLMLSVYVMAPAGQQIYEALSTSKAPLSSIDALMKVTVKAAEPVRHFSFAIHGKRSVIFLFPRQKLCGRKICPAKLNQQIILFSSHLL